MIRKSMIQENTEMVEDTVIEMDEDVFNDILGALDNDAFDQLDELSRKTLSSYVSKVAGKIAHTNPSTSKSRKMRMGVERAARRLAKEDLDYLEDLADIIESLSDEELGYLDELSKQTVGNYVSGVTGKLVHTNPNTSKSRKMRIGVDRAVKRLTDKKPTSKPGRAHMKSEDLDYLEDLADIIEDLSDEELGYLEEMGKKMHGGGAYSMKDMRRIRWMERKGKGKGK